MSRNIELKMRCTDVRRAHRVARELGATHHATERQRDTYFRCATGRLKLREVWPADSAPPSAGPAGASQRSELIGYRRGDESRPRPSDYEVVAVVDAGALRHALAGALGVAAEVAKHRTVYLYEHVRIHVDEVTDLGAFLEFEAIVDAACNEPAARTKVDRLRTAFGVADAEVVAVSYADMIARA